MPLLLDGSISQGFWRWVYPANRAPQDACLRTSFDDCVVNRSDIERLAPAWLDDDFIDSCGGRIGVLVTDRGMMRQSQFHRTSLWERPFPEGSFFDLGGGVLIASPSLTFLRMANVLSLPELIAYGAEICGCYSLDGRNHRGMNQRDVPLVTTAQLGRFLSSARGCTGCKRATRAFSFLVEGSASPMETVCEMLLCLPYRLGGYGIAFPVMNHRVDLDERASRLAGRAVCYVDVCWPQHMIGLEYQGRHDHAEVDSFDSDRARINALSIAGYSIIELTYGQIADLFSFEEIALRVASVVGKRIDKDKLGATTARLELRRALFDWNERGGLLQ